MKKLVLVSALLIALTACRNKDKIATSPKVENLMIAPPANDAVGKSLDEPEPAGRVKPAIEKKIIKEGNITFETNNISKTRKTVGNSLNKFEGYVAEETETNNGDDNRKEYTIKARIPAKNFDRFLDAVSSGADRIDSKNISIKDVTTEYIDITTQLANKKKLEDSYLALLKKGTKISDLLEIENKLTEIQSDIESTQGQLNYLTKQVEYSELDITFYTKLAVEDNGKTFGYKLTSALADGWEISGVLFFGIIGLWPLWIVAIALFMIARRWRQKMRDRKAKAQ